MKKLTLEVIPKLLKKNSWYNIHVTLGKGQEIEFISIQKTKPLK